MGLPGGWLACRWWTDRDGERALRQGRCPACRAVPLFPCVYCDVALEESGHDPWDAPEGEPVWTCERCDRDHWCQKGRVCSGGEPGTT